MNEPLRQDCIRAPGRGDDLGDVLASIRRLIAQDGTARAESLPPATPPLPGPMAAAPAAETGTDTVPVSPARTAAVTSSLAEAVDAAAARMADTARRVEAARTAPAEPPFRLNPDALIPARPP